MAQKREKSTEERPNRSEHNFISLNSCSRHENRPTDISSSTSATRSHHAIESSSLSLSSSLDDCKITIVYIHLRVVLSTSVSIYHSMLYFPLYPSTNTHTHTYRLDDGTFIRAIICYNTSYFARKTIDVFNKTIT